MNGFSALLDVTMHRCTAERALSQRMRAFLVAAPQILTILVLAHPLT